MFLHRLLRALIQRSPASDAIVEEFLRELQKCDRAASKIEGLESDFSALYLCPAHEAHDKALGASYASRVYFHLQPQDLKDSNVSALTKLASCYFIHLVSDLF